VVTAPQSAFVIKRFCDDHYTAIFNPHSGFFARMEDSGCDEVFWASHGPELIDVSITNYCDRACAVCYRNSTRSGSHMTLNDFRRVMHEAKSTHVFQVALGGGNPNQHPEFPEILRISREDFGIVPNYTTNGRGLTDEVVKATAKFCGAVAISAYPPYVDVEEAIVVLSGSGIRPNIHFTLTSKSIDTAIAWLDNPPSFLDQAGAIIFLNYKPVGRCTDERLLLNRSPRLPDFLLKATTMRRPFRVGFDSCSVTGLAQFGQASRVCLEGCDAGRFSLFVSEQMEVFPCSYMVEAGYKGISLRDTKLMDIWSSSTLFRDIRSRHVADRCGECSYTSTCLSGCPLFTQVSLCDRKQRDRSSSA
jgi:radical SAM protein with 4Fe4S-binding SPASM domain